MHLAGAGGSAPHQELVEPIAHRVSASSSFPDLVVFLRAHSLVASLNSPRSELQPGGV